jgi:outer membrane immunogenic protein
VVQSTLLLGLISAPVTSFAADFAPPPPVGKAMPYVAPAYRWDGFYAGINGGGSFGSSYWDIAGNSFNVAGWLAGATIGYNMQFSRWVFGVEADYDYADITGVVTVNGCAARCSLRNNAVATVRGRVGYAIDRFLPYFTAGFAYGHLRAAQFGVGTTSKWQPAYTVGAGIEAAAFDNWTVKGEFLFIDYGTYSCSPVCGPPAFSKVSYYSNLFRLGMNYRF